MTFLRPTLAVFCLWLAILAGPTRAETAATFTLPNGLQIVVLPDHRLPIVSHVLYIKAGSADDPPGQSGIAHFLEHLMFKGTKRFPNGQYDHIVTLAGGTSNAYTSSDKTYYYEQVLQDGLARMMELDADRMAGLEFAPIEAEHELKVVLEERRSFDNDPDSVLAAKTARALYGTAAYGHPVLGDWAETAALTMPSALAFQARYYAPGSAIVVVAGDTTPGAVRDIAGAVYGKLPAGPAPPPRPGAASAPPCAEDKVAVRHERVARDKASLVFLTPGADSMGEQSAAALKMLAASLEDQGSSPIWRDLSVQQGLISGLAVSHDLKLAAGEFAITVEAESGVSAARLESALRDSLAALRLAGIAAPALADAKRHWLAARVLAADDQLGTATRYGEQLAIGRTLAAIESEPQTIAAVTVADINAVLGDYLPNRCFVTALLEGTGEPPDGPARVPAHAGSAVH